MKVLLVPAGGPSIGLGHLQRCCALANALVRQGSEAWILVPLGCSLAVEQRAGSGVHRIPGSATNQEAGVALRIREACSIGTWCVVFDGYQIPPEGVAEVRRLGHRVASIDDFGIGAVQQPDLIVDQNIGATSQDYNLEDGAVLLHGPSYAMLRDEFGPDACSWSLPENLLHAGILVTMGGSDPDGRTLAVLDEVLNLAPDSMRLRVILGPSFGPNLVAAIEQMADRDSRLELVRDPLNMAVLFSESGLVVSAAGSTTYEILRIGVPAIFMPIASNQVRLCQAIPGGSGLLKMDGLVFDRSRFRSLFREAFQELSLHEAVMGRPLIDGQGAIRVAAWLRGLGVGMRPISMQDAAVLFAWANDAVTRANSLSVGFISWDEHLEWLGRRLKDSSRRQYIFTDADGGLVGTTRVDISARNGLVSITVAPEARGRRLGLPLLLRTIQTAWFDLDLKSLRAQVREENRPSMRIFEKAGFRRVECEEGVVAMVLQRHL